MQTAALRDRLKTSITRDGTLTLDASLLPEAGALAAYPDPKQSTSARLVVYGASVVPGSDPATVNGTATLLGLNDLPVVLTAHGDDGSTALELTVTGIPAAWHLRDSFGAFPQYWAALPDDGGGLSLQDSFLDTLPITTVTLVVATAASGDGRLQPGLNLLGILTLDDQFAGGLAAGVRKLGGNQGGSGTPGSTVLPFSGTIRLAPGQPPAIDLRAALDGIVTFSVGSLQTGKPFLWLHTVTPVETAVPVSRMDLAARVTIGSPNPMAMTIAAELFAGGDRVGFWGFSEDETFSLGNGLRDLAPLLGLSPGDLALPSTLNPLAKLYVREVGAVFSLADTRPDFLSLTLALPADPPWDTHIPNVSIVEVETGWMVSFGPDAGVDGYVAGVFRLGKDDPVDLDIRAEFPTFELTAELEIDPAHPFSLSKAVTHFIDEVPDLPEIDLSALYLWADPTTGDFSLSGSLAGDWSFGLGSLSTFSIADVYFTVNRSSGAGFSGSVGGDARIGSATLSAAYAFPGNIFAIEGKVPAIQLGELVGVLSDRAITLPDALNLTLTNSDVAISKAGSDYTFTLKTSVADYGTLFFEILRTSAQGWGAAVGIDLTAVRRLGDVKPFDFLNQIDLTFERMILVLSSTDLPIGYAFPDVVPRQQQTTPSRRVTIPASVGAPKQGINFYAAFAFGDRSATGHAPLLKLYDFLSISRIDVDVALQISEQGGNLTALLMAGGSADGTLNAISGGNATHHMSVAAYLGVKYTPGNVDVFLRGLLTLASPGGKAADTLAFAMELGIEENGFSIAGSMTGSWSNPFGVSGLTVSDVALEVGADWDGIPTVGFAGTLTEGPFNGSIACVLNSVDPGSSVLAASLSDVRLGDVVSTFVGAVAQPDPETAKIIGVLDQVSIGGVSSFTMPASVSAALDAKDLTAVAQAFQTYGPNVPLTPTAQATLLVVGTPGQAWFITDKTAVVRHYEVRRDGDRLTAKLEAQLYVCPNPTTIASMTFAQGYQIYGSLTVFGFSEMTAVTISPAQGIAVEERMSEIDLFDGRLRIRRAPGDTKGDGQGDRATRSGPYLSLSTFTQPSQPPPFRGAHFMVSGALSFLGIVDLVLDVTVTSSGLHVLVDRNLFGADLNFQFDFSTSPLALSGGGHAGLVLNPRIDLRQYGLGVVTVAGVTFSATLAFGAAGSGLTASASGDLSFHVPTFGDSVGPYHLNCDLSSVDQAFTQLAALFESAAHDVARIADDLYGVLKTNAKTFVELVNSGAVALDDTLDHVLQAVYGVTLADLTATTTCFATAAVAPRLRLVPAGATAARVTAAADEMDPLDRLRQLRSDLGGYPMGEWLLNVYNTISEPLVHLYEYQPADPNAPTLEQVLDDDDGQAMYEELLGALQAAGTSQPIALSQDFLSNAGAIVAAVLDLAPPYGQTGAEALRDATLIAQGVNALLNQLPALGDAASQGLTYAQIKDKIARMTVPQDPFAGSPAEAASAAGRA